MSSSGYWPSTRAAIAPPVLRKGPRGGGRDRDQIVAHVRETEVLHARMLGLKEPAFPPEDVAAVGRVRARSLIPVSKSTVIAACRYDETATEQNGHGALTQGLLDSITQSSSSVSYLQLIDQLRDNLQNKLGLTQTPTLLGQENRQNDPILAPWDISA